MPKQIKSWKLTSGGPLGLAWLHATMQYETPKEMYTCTTCGYQGHVDVYKYSLLIPAFLPIVPISIFKRGHCSKCHEALAIIDSSIPMYK